MTAVAISQSAAHAPDSGRARAGAASIFTFLGWISILGYFCAYVGKFGECYIDASSPTVGSSRSWKSMEMEIQSLLEKLLDINDSMGRCAASAALTTSVAQKLARHRDILRSSPRFWFGGLFKVTRTPETFLPSVSLEFA